MKNNHIFKQLASLSVVSSPPSLAQMFDVGEDDFAVLVDFDKDIIFDKIPDVLRCKLVLYWSCASPVYTDENSPNVNLKNPKAVTSSLE